MPDELRPDSDDNLDSAIDAFLEMAREQGPGEGIGLLPPSDAIPWTGPAAVADPPELDSTTAELIGGLSKQTRERPRYRFIEELASGGMGAILKVWDNDLRRVLAMKVVRARSEKSSTPQETTHKLARFLEEAQVAGQLDHPGVVPVHEIGLDAEGEVFFTMRLVRGRDLKHIFQLVHEEKDGWSMVRVLGVILKVCETMAYAHEKGVVHRDLKPSNIMAGRYGEVYVMDWGLARVEGRRETRDIRLRPRSSDSLSHVHTDRRDDAESDADSPLVTMDGAVVGTPYYMPPEQAEGRVQEVGPTSDVYSVGAMLYQLLTGAMPYSKPGSRHSPHTVLAMVLQGPPRPVHEQAPLVPSELVAICEKAMQRDPAARYPTMEKLADDLRAFIEGRVVAAYETGAFAEAKKWIVRNKLTAATAAAAIALAIGGLGSTTYVEAKGRADANRSNAVTDAVADFLVDVFEAPHPRESRGESVTAKELLDRGTQTIESVDDVLVQARLRSVMGEAYLALGLRREAAVLLEQARTVQMAQLGERHRDTLSTLSSVAELSFDEGRWSEAESMMRRVYSGFREVYGDNHELTVGTLSDLGVASHMIGDLEAAEEHLLHSLRSLERTTIEDLEGLEHAIQANLADVYRESGRFDEGIALAREAVAGIRRLRGDDDYYALAAVKSLANCLMQTGRDDAESETLFLEALRGYERTLGVGHFASMEARVDLAEFYWARARNADAESLYRQAVAAAREAYGEESEVTCRTRIALAWWYEETGEYPKAEQLCGSVLDLLRDSGAEDTRVFADAAYHLATVFLAQGRLVQSDVPRLLEEALDAYRRTLGEDHSATLTAADRLAQVYISQGRTQEAGHVAQSLLGSDPIGKARRELSEKILDQIQR